MDRTSKNSVKPSTAAGFHQIDSRQWQELPTIFSFAPSSADILGACRRENLVSPLVSMWTKHGSFQLLRALTCLLGIFHLNRTDALNPSRHISQYGHTAWRLQDGFFNGSPSAITQTADGYRWIGTITGLLRFDGVRFVPWTGSEGQQLPIGDITSLLAAKDGSLWIGDHGLSLWKDGTLTTYPIPGHLNAILEDEGGGVWITRSRVGTDNRGPLCLFANLKSHCYGNEANKWV